MKTLFVLINPVKTSLPQSTETWPDIFIQTAKLKLQESLRPRQFGQPHDAGNLRCVADPLSNRTNKHSPSFSR